MAMDASEEIRRVVDRFLSATHDGDTDTVMGKISEHAGVLVIGTAEEEWWHRQDAAVWEQQLLETGGFPFAWYEIEAWEEGTVGWAAANMTFAGPDETFPFRSTFVLHLELGEWKVVQWHVSACRPNIELVGKELTVSLEQLEETIRRERPDLSGALAADGTVTILFTDIVDSTVLTARLGDHAWLDALRRHNEVIRDTASAHGGTVVETQGDGSMLAFSSARRAVACAQGIQAEIDRVFADASAPIRVRIGIHTGDAVQEADRFYGRTVHYAARVASNALGGEVLVSNLVRELVAGSGVKFRESREVELKGLDGSHRLSAVDLG
jgi:class 3 adenylate cyclase